MFWHKSIFEGYERHQVSRRPFLMSRSGTAGIQRYGAAMWSGDIGSNLASLATHENARLHMSFSGIDYFGSDIGGFHRGALAGDLNEMYTQWFAMGLAFDVPARTHTENLCNCKETAPDRIGDTASNLANLRQRLELAPYYYSLFHRAHQFGEPVVPPLVFYYQDDLAVREMGHEKLIGRDLLVAIVAAHGETKRNVYLPAGTWYNYHSGERIESSGQWIGEVSVFRDGLFRLPMFVRGGAILPLAHVDEKTMNVFGRRTDGSLHDALRVRVYPSLEESQFTLYEDDGETTAYQTGAVRETTLRHQSLGNSLVVEIAGAVGDYEGAPSARETHVEVAGQATSVEHNGVPVAKQPTLAALAGAPSGWVNSPDGLIVVKIPPASVASAHRFDFTLTNEVH